MAKLLLLSILAATVVMPSLAAGETSAVRGLKKLLVQMFVFCVLYWLAVVLLTPQG
ncbi:MAG: hypothetical protein NVS2B9_08340 [Myxococcales bacterium]